MFLINSMSWKKEEFKPRKKREVKIFTCGPSVYRRPHIGNYRTFLYEDILVRYLEYSGYSVKRVINFTDVEDKSISEAMEKGIPITVLTDGVKERFRKEASGLHIKLPAHIPSSSTTVDTAAEVIRTLVERGHAYWHNGDVFFDPLTKPDFGKLYGLDMSKWPRKKVRFKKDTYTGRRWNRGDFILWHGRNDGAPAMWDTAIGKGRPSWNIQDPAAIIETLGGQIDINCGGIDNMARHHDYNIAVMEAYTGKPFASIYLHGEHLVVDGKTMSKSRGNILYPEHVIKNGVTAEHLRFFLFSRHYRKKLNFSTGNFDGAAGFLDAFNGRLRDVLNAERPEKTAGSGAAGRIDDIVRCFRTCMDDDIAAAEAMRGIYSRMNGLHLSGNDRRDFIREMRRIDSVLQVMSPLGRVSS